MQSSELDQQATMVSLVSEDCSKSVIVSVGDTEVSMHISDNIYRTSLLFSKFILRLSHCL